ncbi:MAG: bifunctional DNA-formamidopyrimidine glycosylase/DNA-(apurinic or apyrimidinic site) lyase [Candidatus Terrybacteria bacterium]|nr:bifunctional DNA-formamidopyrimidine glycosylase/DNA-(apurinic or apyrimidinic site) lyase [Candidatus Terrybacteria bacterium]
MPELPEVETIVNDLKKVLPGLKIRDVWTDLKKLPKNIKKEVVGRKILKVERRGKNILIHLDKSLTLLVHQKMTGHLLYGKWQKKNGAWQSAIPGPLRDPENRFIHLIFFLSNGWQLALCDMRKFAKVVILATEKIPEEFRNIGPDPFDKGLSFVEFKKIVRGKSGKIKIVLMDQSVIAGIGNIYSDEILWLAGVHPLKPAQKLKEEEIKNIYKAIKQILNKAIKARGSSYIDYRDAFGRKGNYQKMHYAYQQTGKKCKKKDNGIIKKIRIAGRSAHFCPTHQKL